MIAENEPGARIEIECRADLIEYLRTVRAAIDQIAQKDHDRLRLMIIRMGGDVSKHGFEKIGASMDIGNGIDGGW